MNWRKGGRPEVRNVHVIVGVFGIASAELNRGVASLLTIDIRGSRIRERGHQWNRG